MRKHWILLAGLAFAPALVAAQAAPTAAVLRQDDILPAFFRGEYPAVKTAIEAFLAGNPQDAHGTFFLARTYSSLGMPDQARALFAKAALLYDGQGKQREAKQVRCFTDMLYGATTQQRWDRADEYLNEYDSGEYEALLSRARENVEQKRYGPAADDYSKAAEVFVRTGNTSGVTEARHGQFYSRAMASEGQEAVDNFRRALELRPDDPYTHWGLGERYYQMQQDQAAIYEYRHAGDLFASRGDVANQNAVMALTDLQGRRQREAQERAQKLEDTRLRVLGTWKHDRETLTMHPNQTYSLWNGARQQYPRQGGWRVLEDGRVQLMGAGGGSDWFMDVKGAGWVSINGTTWNK